MPSRVWAAGGLIMSSLEEHAEIILGSGEPVGEWSLTNRGRISAAIDAKGAALLRGFSATADDCAEKVLSALGEDLLDNAFWSTPRSSVGSKTFTATEYANTRTIPLHSEMSYATAWPRLIAFHALVAAEEGGETTLCNLDRLSDALGDIAGDFARRGVRYQRTHHAGVDIPWRKAYQTDSRAEAEKIARDNGADVKWLDGDILHTAHTAQGAIRREDGRALYFNQSNLFHPAALAPAAAAQLKALFGAEKLPRNATYADGAPIADETVKRVNAEFDARAVGVNWRPGDVLLIDNLRHAHGRRPFRGARKLHVALARQESLPERKKIAWR